MFLSTNTEKPEDCNVQERETWFFSVSAAAWFAMRPGLMVDFSFSRTERPSFFSGWLEVKGFTGWGLQSQEVSNGMFTQSSHAHDAEFIGSQENFSYTRPHSTHRNTSKPAECFSQESHHLNGKRGWFKIKKEGKWMFLIGYQIVAASSGDTAQPYKAEQWQKFQELIFSDPSWNATICSVIMELNQCSALAGGKRQEQWHKQ